jgi:hypothetical protein
MDFNRSICLNNRSIIENGDKVWRTIKEALAMLEKGLCYAQFKKRFRTMADVYGKFQIGLDTVQLHRLLRNTMKIYPNQAYDECLDTNETHNLKSSKKAGKKPKAVMCKSSISWSG